MFRQSPYYIVALAEIMKNKSVNTTVQIVDPNVPAGGKSGPLIGTNMMVTGIMSLLIEIFLSLFLESLSKRNKE